MELTLQGIFNIFVAILILVLYLIANDDGWMRKINRIETKQAEQEGTLDGVLGILRQLATTDEQKLRLGRVLGLVEYDSWRPGGPGWYVNTCANLSPKELLDYATLCERVNTAATEKAAAAYKAAGNV